MQKINKKEIENSEWAEFNGKLFLKDPMCDIDRFKNTQIYEFEDDLETIQAEDNNPKVNWYLSSYDSLKKFESELLINDQLCIYLESHLFYTQKRQKVKGHITGVDIFNGIKQTQTINITQLIKRPKVTYTYLTLIDLEEDREAIQEQKKENKKLQATLSKADYQFQLEEQEASLIQKYQFIDEQEFDLKYAGYKIIYHRINYLNALDG